jgi:hypothetical protein
MALRAHTSALYHGTVGTWPIVVIAVLAVLGSLALGAATRGRARRRLDAEEGRERELSPREKLVRDGGMASFGLNLPWWTRRDPGRQRASGRRRS